MDIDRLHKLKKKLEKKGWSKKEIDHLVHVMYSPEKKQKHLTYKQESNKVLYWMAIIVLTVVNFIIAIFLIPFMIPLTGSLIYPIIIVLAIIFGLMYDLIITDIEHLEKKHHITAALVVPIITLVNIFFITTISNRVAEFLQVPVKHNPFFISIVYAVFFIAPFLILNIFRKFSS